LLKVTLECLTKRGRNRWTKQELNLIGSPQKLKTYTPLFNSNAFKVKVQINAK